MPFQGLNDWFEYEPVPTPRPTPVIAPELPVFKPDFFRSCPKNCYVCNKGTEAGYRTKSTWVPVCSKCYLHEVYDVGNK
jgi:hypothetical protein